MFSDETLDSVDFKSTWHKSRSLRDGGTQTSEIITYEVETQAVKSRGVGVQTDEEPEKEFRLIDDTSEKFKEFLRKAEQEVSRELRKNIRSHAFDGYQVNWNEANDSVSVVHLLKQADLVEQHELQCTDLSWNSVGSVVAVAYGRFDHQDWCTHKSALCTWNLDRITLDSNKADTLIELSSCLICITFHPKKPACIAGGSFNGEVVVWDLSQDGGAVVAMSGIGDDSHREPVSKLRWIENGKKYNLVSVSSDGKTLVWKVNAKKKALELMTGFVLMTDSMPKSSKTQLARLKDGKEMGVTSISYAYEDKSLFVIGSESGGVFKCSMNSKKSALTSSIGAPSSVELYSPVTFAFQPHLGPVYSVDCSPFHRNVFLTCGTDTSARIYSMLQSEPLLSLEPGAGYLYSAHWSPVCPMVFAVAAGHNQLLIYDLRQSRLKPAYTLQAGQGSDPVYTLAFNPSQRHLLATGDGGGLVGVWRLNTQLCSQAPREEEMLAQLANTTLE